MNIETANRLLNLRKQHNLSQEQLAEKLGISRQSVSKWERAEASPDTDNLIELAKLYQISLDELLGTGLNNKTEPAVREGDTEESPAQATEAASVTAQDDALEDQASAGDAPESDPAPQDNGEQKSPDGGTLKKEKVHVGWNGIHIQDGDEQVHIGLRGIHVKDAEDEVHIGLSGIRVKDRKDAVQVEDGRVFVNGKEYKKGDFIKHHKKGWIATFPFALLVCIGFFICGAYGYWHPGWILFLTVPVWHSIVEAVQKRDLSAFCYPVLVVIVFLLLGFYAGAWHPGWVLFLTIPFFYWIANGCKQEKENRE